MKQPYIPLEKRSKREQKEHFTARRGSWGDVNPVTKKSPNPKAYNRKKIGRRYEHEPLPDFYVYIWVNFIKKGLINLNIQQNQPKTWQASLLLRTM